MSTFHTFYIADITGMLSSIMLCSTNLIIILTRIEFSNVSNSLAFLTLNTGSIDFNFNTSNWESTIYRNFFWSVVFACSAFSTIIAIDACFLFYLFSFNVSYLGFFRSFTSGLNVSISFFRRYNLSFIEYGAIKISCITNLLYSTAFSMLFRNGEKACSQTCLLLIRKSAV